MKVDKLELRPLRVADETSFKLAVSACAAELPAFGFAFDFNDSAPFEEYVERLEGWTRGEGLQEGFVPNTYLVGVVDGQIVGRLSLRHCLNDYLASIGGHIGYGVVPARRQRGYATEMLRQALPLCASIGLRKVLITCDVDNIGSRKVIERCGGILEGITALPHLTLQKRRYWIELPPFDR